MGMYLLLSITALTVPSMATYVNLKDDATGSMLKMSRGISFVMLFAYPMLLIFQYKTFRADKVSKSEEIRRRLKTELIKQEQAQINDVLIVTSNGKKNNLDDMPEKPSLTFTPTIIALILSIALLAVHTDLTTNTLTDIAQNLSNSFVGLVLLPLFSIDPSCITEGIKDKQDYVFSITMSKCLQTALVLTPLIVLLGWILDVPQMTLQFNNFDVGILFASVIVINYITAIGSPNW
jgi:Ca2+:H+ antiporter